MTVLAVAERGIDDLPRKYVKKMLVFLPQLLRDSFAADLSNHRNIVLDISSHN